MNEPRSATSATLARRVLAVLGLLTIPTIATVTWHWSLNERTPPFYRHVIGYLSWGLADYFPALGVYFVTRQKLCSSYSGWCRALLYSLAAVYGYVCFGVVQDWLVGNAESPPIPGTRIEHFGAASMVVLRTLSSIWASWPMLFLFRRRLTDRTLTEVDLPRPNVRFFLAWTALAAIILVTLRILALYGKPLKVAAAYQGVQAALRDVFIQLPIIVVHVLTVLFIMVVIAGGVKRCLWALPCAVLFRFLGEQAVFSVAGQFSEANHYGILSGPWQDRLPYFAGSTLIWLGIFAVAARTGLTFRSAGQLSERNVRETALAGDHEAEAAAGQ